MRILYFTRDYTSHDHRFLASLSKTKNSIFFLRLGRRHHSLEQPLPPNVQNVSWARDQRQFQLIHGPRQFFTLRQVIKAVKPDLIHAGPIHSAGFLAALSRFQPLVIMSWGSDILIDADQNFFWQMITRYTIKQSTIFIGDCTAVEKKAISYGVPKEHIVTFPWGVNLKTFTPKKDNGLRKRLDWCNSIIILSVRSWEPIYGVDVAVRAFIKASRIIPNLRLVLLGKGSQESLIRKIISDAGMDNRVFFGGQVSQDEISSYYRAADIYLSASYSDGSSVSLMEALASGCPVIVSDIPGNKEWITPGVEGYLFSVGNVKVLSETIIKAVQDQNKLIEMKHNTRSLAEKRANWEINFQQLLKAYEMALTIYNKH